MGKTFSAGLSAGAAGTRGVSAVWRLWGKSKEECMDRARVQCCFFRWPRDGIQYTMHVQDDRVFRTSEGRFVQNAKRIGRRARRR